MCFSFCSTLRFEKCCERGFKGALKLVSFTSSKSEDAIEAQYRKLCKEKTDEDGELHWEDELAEDDPDAFLEHDLGAGAESEHAAFDLLTSIQQTTFVDPEQDPASVEASHDMDPEIEKMADAQEMKLLLEEPSGEGVVESVEAGDHLPSSLLQAMEDSGDKWNSLFRFLVKMRSAPGGVDTGFIANARHMRKSSGKLNWHQPLR